MARRPSLPIQPEAGSFTEGMRWFPVRAVSSLPTAGIPACGVVSGSAGSFNPIDGTTTIGVVPPGYEDDAAFVLSTAGLQANQTGTATDANLVLAAYAGTYYDGFYGTRNDIAASSQDRYKLHPTGPTTSGRMTRPGGFRIIPGSAFTIGSTNVALFLRGGNYASQERTGLVAAVAGLVNSTSALGGQGIGLGTKVVTDGFAGVYHQSPLVRTWTNSEDVYNPYWLSGLASTYGFPAWLEQIQSPFAWAGCVLDSPAAGAVVVSVCNGGLCAVTLSYNYTPAAYIGTHDVRAFVLDGHLPGAWYSSRYAITRSEDGFCYGGDANNAGGHRFRGGLWISYTSPPPPPVVPPIAPPITSPAPSPGLPPPVTGTPTGTDAAIISDLISAVNDLITWATAVDTHQDVQDAELIFLHDWVADVTAATYNANGYALLAVGPVAFAATGTVT